MNKKFYKLIFSKRLNKLIAVGENATGLGKSGQSTLVVGSVQDGLFFTGMLKLIAGAVAALFVSGASFAGGSSIALPAAALPTGASVAAGKATVLQAGNTLTVNQTTSQAIVNWNSFSIGSKAKVIINQPSASSVELDRVTGNNASQIFGQLSSNGQVVLVNPNGIVFGKDGSVSATGFTASTLGITDADFLAGNYNFVSDGSEGLIVNKGKLQTASGGYVALLGAKVTNSGQIIAPDGTVYMGAAQAMTVPLSASGKIKLELTQSAVNAMVSNTAKGTIVAEGGQVYMQAAALNDAVGSTANTASTATTRSVINVNNAGSIDVSGPQAGGVTLLADAGAIKVSGSITANSTNASNTGGQIVIGRDASTGILSATTDVSHAALTAKAGFVETSGEVLKSSGVLVAAGTWLLDPNSVEINSTTTPNTAGDSVVLASDINTALSNGSTVTISTGGAGAVPSASAASPAGTVNITNASTTTGNGDITVNAAITPTMGTLNLNAYRNIVLNSNVSASSIGLTASTGNVSGSGNLATSSSGVLTINAATAGTLTGTISGGALVDSGVGVLTLAGANTYVGSTTINTGTLSFTTPSSSYSSATSLSNLYASSQFNIAAGAILNFNIPTNVTESGNAASTTFSGSGTMTKTGGGKLTWGSYATFALAAGSLIDVQAGTLVGGWNNSLTWTNNKSSLNVASGATFNGVEAGVNVDALTGSGTVNTGYSTNQGSITVGVNNTAAGTYNTTAGNATFSGTINATGTGTSSGLSKVGTGTQILTGSNSYLATSISGGTLQIGSSSTAGTTGSLGTGAVTLSNGANLSYQLDTPTTIPVGNAISGNGNLIANIGGGNALTINAPVSLTGTNNYVALETNGGAISNTATGTIAATNISIDNSNGSINTTTGAITHGAANSGSLVGISIGGAMSATGNFNLYGVSNSNNAINIAANLSGGLIQSTGSTTSGYEAIYWTSGNIAVTGLSGSSSITGNLANNNAGGSAAVWIGGNVGLTASAGTTFNLIGNATGLNSDNYANTRGVRVTNGVTLTTSGLINITGNSKSDDGVLVYGNIIQNGASSLLTITGTESANGGGGQAGYNQLGSITLNNGSSLIINGAAANVNPTMSSAEYGASITGSISGSGGTISIAGAASSYDNSVGLNTTSSITSGGGNITLVGQNLYGSAGNAISIGANVNAGAGNVLIQSMNNQIAQSSGTITGANVTLDNTGAGLTSLIADTTSTPNLAVGTSFGGSINSSTGAIVEGSGKSTGGNVVELNGSGIVASGNVNIAANSANGTYNGFVSASTGLIKTSGANSQVNINSNAVVSDGGAISNTAGTLGVTIAGTGNVTVSGNITASGSSGISISAGNGAGSSSTLTTTNATITQSSGAGAINLSTTGTGNLAVGKIVDNGTGNVTLVGGSALGVGVTTGNVTTTSGDTVTLAGSDNLYVFSGSETGTGNLSYLNSGFNTLSLAGSGLTVNAQNNTAYSLGYAITGSSAKTQVFFRDNTTAAPSFNLTLANLSKVYGSADPGINSSSFLTAYNAASGATTLTSAVGSNTYAMSATTAINGLSFTSATRANYGTLAGEQVSTYAYSGISGTAENVTLTQQPSLIITQASLTVTPTAVSTTYDGVSTYNTLVSNAFSVSGLKSTVDGMTTGDAVTAVSTALNNGSAIVGTGIAQAGSFTQTLSGATGSGLSNYIISYGAPVTGNVAKATLTFTGANSTLTYNGQTQINPFTETTNSGNLNGNHALGSDVLTVSGQASSRNAASGLADSLSVTGTAATLANYIINKTNGSLTINPEAITVTAATASKTYDGSTAITTASPSITSGSVQTGDSITLNGETFANKNVNGTNGSTINANAVTISDGNGGQNYSVSYATAAGTISPKTLTETLTGISKTYDGTTTATIGTSNLSISTGITGESFTVANTTGITGSYANANVLSNSGNGSVTASGISSSNLTAGTNTSINNYVLPTSVTADVGTITPKSATATINSTTTTYNGATQSSVGGLASTTGLVGSDTLSVSGDVVSARNAGYYQTNATATNSNYNVTVNQGTLTINKAALILSAAADTKVYDGTTASSQTVGVSGLRGTDSVVATQVFNSANVVGATTTNVSGYTISDQNGGNNYTVTLNTNTGTITPAPLNIAINSASTTYGTVVPLTYSVSGLVNGQNSTAAGLVLPLTTMGFTSNSTTNNVGQYPITSGTASVGSNYSINAIVNGTLSITPATLTFTATGNAKIVTTSDPTLTYSTSGLVNGDSASVITQAPTLTRAPGEGAGSYAISMSGGNAGSNYTIVNSVPLGTNFTIVGASELLITMNGVTTTYGTLGAPTVSSAKYLDANNHVIYTLTNTSGNTWSDGVGGAITIASTLSGVAVTTSVGTVTGAVTNTNSGTANSSGNFNSVFTQVNNYTVNQAPLTITAANVTRTYDGTNFSSPSASAMGLMNNETLSSLGGVVFSGTAINSRNAGVYTIIPTVAAPSNLGNYSITYQNGQLTTNQANLVLSAGSDSKVYDGTTLSTVIPTSSQLAAGDTISNLTQSFASKNVLGTNGSTLNVNSGYVINDGNHGNNYAVTYQSSTGTITPLATTVTINSASTTYNGSTQSSSGYSVSNLIAGDTLNVLGDTITGRNAGTYTSAATASNSNYAITLDQGTLNIAPKALTITANAVNSTYDGVTTYAGLTAAPAFSASGLVANDAVASVGTTAIQAGSTIGAGSALSGVAQAGTFNYSIGGAQGSGLSNYTITYVGNTGSVAKANLNLTGATTAVTYDGQTQTNTYTMTNTGSSGALNSGNALGADALIVTGMASGRNVIVGGNYADNLQVAVGANTSLSNYNITTTNGSLTINPAALTVSAVTDTKAYDGSTSSSGTPVLSGTVYGTDSVVLNGQTYASSAPAGANRSTLNANPVTIDDQNNGQNYSVTYLAALGTISAAPPGANPVSPVVLPSAGQNGSSKGASASFNLVSLSDESELEPVNSFDDDQKCESIQDDGGPGFEICYRMSKRSSLQ